MAERIGDIPACPRHCFLSCDGHFCNSDGGAAATTPTTLKCTEKFR